MTDRGIPVKLLLPCKRRQHMTFSPYNRDQNHIHLCVTFNIILTNLSNFSNVLHIMQSCFTVSGSTKLYLNTKRHGIRCTFAGCAAGLDRVAVVQLKVVCHWASVAGSRLRERRGAVDWRRGGGWCWLCLTIPYSRATFLTLCEARVEERKEIII